MPKAKQPKKRSRPRLELVTPASRAIITRAVCQGTCRQCRRFPQQCDCGNYQADHSYQGSRRGIKIEIYLVAAANRDGHRVRYRVHFPALRPKHGAGRRAGAEDMTGTVGTVFDALARIQRRYERRELRP